MASKNKTIFTVIPGKQEFTLTREFDAPRELVFKAYTDEKLLVRWLGPRRLTMIVEKNEVKSGGSWRFIHTDKNGTKYRFHGVFHEVTPPERIIRTFEFEGLPEPGHVSLETALFEALPGNRTRVTSQSVFRSVADRDGMVQPGMEEDLNEMYDRLDEVVSEGGAMDKKTLVITRVLNAPKELVFRAWTEPEWIKKWWGPQGFTAPVIKVDLRKGGSYLYAMEDGEGRRYWSGGEYREVEAPNRIVVSDHFADEKGNKRVPADYGLDPDFPEVSIVTVTFAEEEGKTRLSISYDLPESAAVREAIRKTGMIEGWNSSLDKLQAAVEKR